VNELAQLADSARIDWIGLALAVAAIVAQQAALIDLAEAVDGFVKQLPPEHLCRSLTPEQRSARGPPELIASVGWLEDEQRAPDDDDNSTTASDVE
jgi:hypothetical protein